MGIPGGPLHLAATRAWEHSQMINTTAAGAFHGSVVGGGKKIGPALFAQHGNLCKAKTARARQAPWRRESCTPSRRTRGCPAAPRASSALTQASVTTRTGLSIGWRMLISRRAIGPTDCDRSY